LLVGRCRAENERHLARPLRNPRLAKTLRIGRASLAELRGFVFSGEVRSLAPHKAGMKTMAQGSCCTEILLQQGANIA
jgi:hypothetical protein